MIVFNFFKTPLIDYKKLFELQSKESTPDAYQGKKSKR
jgi:hypothetical protein